MIIDRQRYRETDRQTNTDADKIFPSSTLTSLAEVTKPVLNQNIPDIKLPLTQKKTQRNLNQNKTYIIKTISSRDHNNGQWYFFYHTLSQGKLICLLELIMYVNDIL